MRIALYFGSFNPVHQAHLIIASHVVSHCPVDQVWFVLSPQNPLKESRSLLNEQHRLHLLRLAVENDSRFRVSDIEFRLPRPSYTIDTLLHVKEKYPAHQFSVLMGSDSFSNITRWKNYSQLLQENDIIVYERPGFEVPLSLSRRIQIVQAPMLDVSSTLIRKLIAEKKSIRYLVPDAVREHIEANHYYQ